MRAAVTLLLLTTCVVVQAHVANSKYSASTQMFLQEQARRSGAVNAPERRTANHRSRPVEQYIASPDTIDGTGVVLGIVDDGIDFRHIAFKDKDGRSRIKRASTQ